MIETACLDKRFDIECLYRSLNILKGEYKDIIKEYTEKDIEAINSLDTDVAQYFELIPEYIFSVLDDPKIVKAFNDLNIIIKNNKKRENLITIFKNNTYKKFVEIIKKDEKKIKI